MENVIEPPKEFGNFASHGETQNFSNSCPVHFRKVGAHEMFKMHLFPLCSQNSPPLSSCILSHFK